MFYLIIIPSSWTSSVRRMKILILSKQKHSSEGVATGFRQLFFEGVMRNGLTHTHFFWNRYDNRTGSSVFPILEKTSKIISLVFLRHIKQNKWEKRLNECSLFDTLLFLERFNKQQPAIKKIYISRWDKIHLKWE